MIYLDYAASSRPFPEGIALTGKLAGDIFGNPGALHQAGNQARKILRESRHSLAQLTNVRPEEIFFTSGGTEANNWAIQIGSAVPGKKHILCSAMEHSSVLEPVRQLGKKGFSVSWLQPDDQGRILPEAAEAALRPDTVLLCVQAVNNETGVIQDVAGLAAVAKRHRIRFFCDAVQSFGHVDQPLDQADLISLSAHKLGGPRGVGCLIIRQPLIPLPMILGGGQEFGLRSGTENLPAIGSFALAARLSREALPREQQRLEGLCRQLTEGFRQICPEVSIAGEQARRSGILSCRFPGIPAEKMVLLLDAEGICVSPGAACAARSGEVSHVLRSMGYSPREAGEFVRFSPGWGTTEEEIQAVIAAVARIYSERR